MNTYAVKYLDGTDLKVAYVQGGNQSQAGKEFSAVRSNINSEQILSVSNINEQNNDYNIAIAAARLTSLLGWIGVVVGVVVIVLALVPLLKGGTPGIGEMLALLPSLGMLIGGLISIIIGQASRAVMDNANYSRQMLDEMRYGR